MNTSNLHLALSLYLFSFNESLIALINAKVILYTLMLPFLLICVFSWPLSTFCLFLCFVGGVNSSSVTVGSDVHISLKSKVK